MVNKKLLITGSCGFIGSNFVRKAVYEKFPYQLVSIDRVNTNTLNSMYWNKNHTFHVADIRDQHIIDTIFQFEKPDIVLHLAAETFVDTSLKDPNSFITNNVLGTQVIINSCVKYKVEKLIMASTDEVMGQLSDTTSPSWKETDPVNPRNPYSASKMAGELLVKAAYESYGLIYNITRSSNNYGPRQNPEKLIPKTIKCILQNTKIPIYGKGEQIRDWTHVFDNCSAIMKIIESGKPNEIYNISANQEFSNLEVIHEICKNMNNSHHLMEFITDPRGNAHDFRYSIDSSKLKQIGWKPTIQFKKHLNELCLQWYNSNQWWFK